MDLVPGVERHPAAVEVEAAGADLAAAELLEDDLAVDDLAVALDGGAADIAVAVRRLAARQLGDDVADALAHRRIAGLGVHQRAGRKIMAQRMAGDAARLPAAISRALGLEPGAGVEIVEQPVGLDREEEAPVGLDRAQEDRGLEPHRLERHRPHADRLPRRLGPPHRRGGERDRARRQEEEAARDHGSIATTATDRAGRSKAIRPPAFDPANGAGRIVLGRVERVVRVHRRAGEDLPAGGAGQAGGDLRRPVRIEIDQSEVEAAVGAARGGDVDHRQVHRRRSGSAAPRPAPDRASRP